MRLVKREKIKKPDVTYNLHLKKNHNYFANNALAKNCHLSTGASITEIVKTMTKCRFKIGLTGTLKDGKANLLQYIGLFGKVFRPVTTKQLMDEGQVSKLRINVLQLNYTQEDAKKVAAMKYADEIEWLLNNKQRNLMIIKLALSKAKTGKNSVVMFRQKKHGKLLYAALKKVLGDDKVFYIDGDVKDEYRDNLRKNANNMDGIVIVASYGVFSTGLSIKKLHYVFFAHPTKSKITVFQSIGRILRLHKSKNMAILVDIIDNLAVKNTRKNAKKKYSKINYALDHGLQRLDKYNSEQFEYKITKVEMK